MRFYRPQSFFALLLTAFVFVTLPLVIALFTSGRLLDSLVRQGADAVYRSVDLVRASRQMLFLLNDEERKARLYHVLGDQESLVSLREVHTNLRQALDQLAAMWADQPALQEIEEFAAREQYLVAVISHPLLGDPEARVTEVARRQILLESYRELGQLARGIEQAGNEQMLARVSGLKQSVRKGKETLIYQTGGFIIAAGVLIILFVAVLSRPVRQIDRAIDRLGEGDFKTSIQVGGPRDLELLGRKLDWLRLRLAELDKEKARLIAHISHELKTPLASIKEGIGLLRDQLVGPVNEGQGKVVEILDKNCSKLQRLIQHILDFNMIQAGKKPEAMVPVQIDSLMQKVLIDHQHAILNRNITLRVRCDQVKVMGNGQQLRTVFDNLLSNAVKFTPEGGTISVNVVKNGSRARCEIADSGPGVPAEERSRIFSPFFQGKTKSAATVKGSGLGLAISKEYIQNHGGTLCLLAGGNGARFEASLPLLEDKEA